MSREMKGEELLEKLRGAAAWATREGHSLKPGLWGVRYSRVLGRFVRSDHTPYLCLMGAVLLQHGEMPDGGELLVEHAARVLDEPVHVVEQIISGFDGRGPTRGPWWVLGEQLRKEWGT